MPQEGLQEKTDQEIHQGILGALEQSGDLQDIIASADPRDKQPRIDGEVTPNTISEADPEVQEADESVDETTEEVESSEESEDISPDPKEDNAQLDAEEGGEESEQFSTLDELAEATGMEKDAFLKTIKATASIDGEKTEVNLDQLIRSYQMQGHLSSEINKLKREQEAFEQSKLEKLKAYDEQLDLASSMAESLEKSFLAGYEQVDWDALRRESPADYAVHRQDYNERLQKIQALKDEITSKRAAQKQEQEKEFKEKLTQVASEEYNRMLEYFPELSDQAKGKEFLTKVQTYLASPPFNYDPKEIDAGLIDHRQYLLIQKAMAHDEASKTVDLKKKKVLKIPKVLKAGATKGKQETTSQNVQRLSKRLKKYGKPRDAVQLIKEQFL